jgi:hypothetical protein
MFFKKVPKNLIHRRDLDPDMNKKKYWIRIKSMRIRNPGYAMLIGVFLRRFTGSASLQGIQYFSIKHIFNRGTVSILFSHP